MSDLKYKVINRTYTPDYKNVDDEKAKKRFQHVFYHFEVESGDEITEEVAKQIVEKEARKPREAETVIENLGTQLSGKKHFTASFDAVFVVLQYEDKEFDRVKARDALVGSLFNEISIAEKLVGSNESDLVEFGSEAAKKLYRALELMSYPVMGVYPQVVDIEKFSGANNGFIDSDVIAMAKNLANKNNYSLGLNFLIKMDSSD